ncbi:hypothetical protein [Listeria kieliensis]
MLAASGQRKVKKPNAREARARIENLKIKGMDIFRKRKIPD